MASKHGWLALSCALLACNGTRTGNPYDEPPEYQTSTRFAVEGVAPGGGPTHGGNDGGNPDYSPFNRSPSAAAAFFGKYLVAPVPGRGVLVFDVEDRAAPTLVAELPIDGQIYQSLFDERGLLLAVSERVAIDAAEIPDAPVRYAQDRIVRVDLSDPTQPTRAFAVDVEGQLWEIAPRGSSLFVIERVLPPSEICAFTGNLLPEGPTARPLRIRRYTLTDTSATPGETLELPEMRGVYFVGDGWLARSEDPDAPELHFVDLASGTAVRRTPLPFDGRVVSASRAGDVLAVLVDRNSALSLELYALENPDAVRARGSLALPWDGSEAAVTLLPEGSAIVDGSQARLIDLRDLDAPRLASTLPSDVMRLLQGPTGLVGLGSSGGPMSSGSLVVSLWDGSDPAAPLRLASVTTDWFYPYADPGAEPWTLDAEHGLLLVPFARPEPTAAQEAAVDPPGSLGVLELDATRVALHSEQAARRYLWGPFSDGTSAFNVSHEGLEVFPLVQDAREPEPVSALVALTEPQPIDRLEQGELELELWEREADGVFYVEVAPRAGGEPTAIDLPHHADGLRAVGERVVVIGIGGNASECEHLAELGYDPSELPEILGPVTSYDPCAPHRARGVSVLELDGEPGIAGTARITSERDFERMEGVEARADWRGYVELDDGRLAFLVERGEHCDSYASCERLGVPAYEGMASPGCNPQRQDCDALPAVEIFVSGHKNGLGVYTLEGVEDGEPRLDLGALLDGRFELYAEDVLDLRHRVLSTDGGLAWAREDPRYDDDGNSMVDEHGDAITRYVLDRVTLTSDGTLRAEPPVNTPGLPVALVGDAVYCLEPRRVSEDAIAVDLHRARLHGAGAFIEHTAEVGEQMVEARGHGDELWVLLGAVDACASDARSRLLAVSLREDDELALGEALDLPGAFWGFPYGASAIVENDTLLLRGGPRSDGWLTVDVSSPLTPEIERYTTSAPGP